MSFKASLKIVLKADHTIVAESENVELWQYVLSQMNQLGEATIPASKHPSSDKKPASQEIGPSFFASPNAAQEDSVMVGLENAITHLADTLNISEEDLQGACRPDMEPPYIHLDKYRWQELKDELPSRGPNAIPSIVIVASILVLWMEEIGDEKPTVDDAQDVLDTIDTRDRNPGRGISNCEWLQLRNEQIVLDPAKITMAVAVARAYCIGKKPDLRS